MDIFFGTFSSKNLSLQFNNLSTKLEKLIEKHIERPKFNLNEQQLNTLLFHAPLNSALLGAFEERNFPLEVVPASEISPQWQEARRFQRKR